MPGDCSISVGRLPKPPAAERREYLVFATRRFQSSRGGAASVTVIWQIQLVSNFGRSGDGIGDDPLMETPGDDDREPVGKRRLRRRRAIAAVSKQGPPPIKLASDGGMMPSADHTSASSTTPLRIRSGSGPDPSANLLNAEGKSATEMIMADAFADGAQRRNCRRPR
jgi:hypothetical protein